MCEERAPAGYPVNGGSLSLLLFSKFNAWWATPSLSGVALILWLYWNPFLGPERKQCFLLSLNTDIHLMEGWASACTCLGFKSRRKTMGCS